MNRTHHVSRSTAAVLLALAGVGAAAPAHAGSIDLGDAGQYAVFSLDGGTLQINSMTVLDGDVGLGADVDGDDNKKALQLGTVYQHSTSTATFNDKNYTATGGIVQGAGGPTLDVLDSLLEQATIDALTVSAEAAQHAGTNLGQVTGSLDLYGTGGANYYTIDALEYNDDTMTLHGSGDDCFIINVLGDFKFAKSRILLDGIGAGQVLFNFPGSGDEIKVYKAESVVNGTFLSALRDIEYHNPATFNGRIIGGGEINLHSDANLVYDVGTTVVPLPAAVWMGLAMIGGGGAWRRLRRRPAPVR